MPRRARWCSLRPGPQVLEVAENYNSGLVRARGRSGSFNRCGWTAGSRPRGARWGSDRSIIKSALDGTYRWGCWGWRHSPVSAIRAPGLRPARVTPRRLPRPAAVLAGPGFAHASVRGWITAVAALVRRLLPRWPHRGVAGCDVAARPGSGRPRGDRPAGACWQWRGRRFWMAGWPAHGSSARSCRRAWHGRSTRTCSN